MHQFVLSHTGLFQKKTPHQNTVYNKIVITKRTQIGDDKRFKRKRNIPRTLTIEIGIRNQKQNAN